MVGCFCNQCNVELIPYQHVSRQLLELSFYTFLEQFFYNKDSLRMYLDAGENTCQHSFHSSCKVNFVIDILRVEFTYHKVDIYSLDLICFKDQPGSLSKQTL